MISKLILPSLTSFGGKDKSNNSTVRSSYNAMMEKNEIIAQAATKTTIQSAEANGTKAQIPMQGKGKKLDIVA